MAGDQKEASGRPEIIGDDYYTQDAANVTCQRKKVYTMYSLHVTDFCILHPL
jgi:hypothetical protein